jgi:hypothetical protein
MSTTSPGSEFLLFVDRSFHCIILVPVFLSDDKESTSRGGFKRVVGLLNENSKAVGAIGVVFAAVAAACSAVYYISTTKQERERLKLELEKQYKSSHAYFVENIKKHLSQVCCSLLFLWHSVWTLCVNSFDCVPMQPFKYASKPTGGADMLKPMGLLERQNQDDFKDLVTRTKVLHIEGDSNIGSFFLNFRLDCGCILTGLAC